MDAWIPFTIIALYICWQALGWNRQRSALASFWALIIIAASVGLLHSCISTGTMPIPSEYPW